MLKMNAIFARMECGLGLLSAMFVLGQAIPPGLCMPRSGKECATIPPF